MIFVENKVNCAQNVHTLFLKILPIRQQKQAVFHVYFCIFIRDTWQPFELFFYNKINNENITIFG
jgi:hypothetical protein